MMNGLEEAGKYLEKDGCRLEGWKINRIPEHGAKIRVKIEGEFSEPESIGRVVRQGYPHSPILFNL